MSDLALRVEGLSKRYRIGKSRNLFERLNVRTFQRSNAPSSERSNVSTFQRSNADILWALKNFSFDVRKGEVMGTLAPARSAGVIGPFGGAGNPRKGARAGSTLLKILSGITEPTSGRAILNGRVGSLLDVSRDPRSRTKPRGGWEL